MTLSLIHIWYTQIVEAILDHENIEVRLNTPFAESMKAEFDHIFWSGPLDAYFGFELGRLGYRTLDFEAFRDEGDFQGNAVINYGDEEMCIRDSLLPLMTLKLLGTPTKNTKVVTTLIFH